tara:strand:+ start:2061 stop:2417 length:357 start_codon:yes stop_codon:yes gene_type:complete
MDKPQIDFNEANVRTLGQITDAVKVIAESINALQKAVIMLKERVDKIEEIKRKEKLDTSVSQMKKEKKYSKKELKEISKVLKPLENILNEDYKKYMIEQYDRAIRNKRYDRAKRKEIK